MKNKNKTTIKKRQKKEKESVLKNLRKTPIIQVACNQTAVSRATYYRWRKEDKKFRKVADEAIKEGELLINDISESQTISLIKEKNWPATRFWLKHNHPKYANRIEVDANIKHSDEKLTPEQEKLVRKALKFISHSEQESSDKKDEKTSTEDN